MRKTETTVISETTYIVTQVPARVGILLIRRIANVLGPFLAAGGELSASVLRDALTDADCEYIVNAFAECTKVPLTLDTSNGQKVDAAPLPLAGILDAHFAGKYAEMFEWLAYCVRVNNLADFFGAAVKALPGVKATASASGLRPASIGSAGESSSPKG